jgi:hypothetical protein
VSSWCERYTSRSIDELWVFGGAFNACVCTYDGRGQLSMHVLHREGWRRGDGTSVTCVLHMRSYVVRSRSGTRSKTMRLESMFSGSMHDRGDIFNGILHHSKNTNLGIEDSNSMELSKKERMVRRKRKRIWTRVSIVAMDHAPDEGPLRRCICGCNMVHAYYCVGCKRLLCSSCIDKEDILCLRCIRDVRYGIKAWKYTKLIKV